MTAKAMKVVERMTYWPDQFKLEQKDEQPDDAAARPAPEPPSRPLEA